VASAWHIRGSYFPSCNCDPICPCRRIDGVAGGRSTHGVCTGVLAWLIEDGRSGETDLTGLAAALAVRYSDDGPGSPWSWILYLDKRADEEKTTALTDIFSGRIGGDALTHFPWAWKERHLLGVRSVVIDVDHTERRQWLRVRDHVPVRIRDCFAGELRVSDESLAFEFSGVCGCGTTFAYAR